MRDILAGLGHLLGLVVWRDLFFSNTNKRKSIQNHKSNQNAPWIGITTEDIICLWKQSEVVVGRGSTGQRVAYYTVLIERLLKERNDAKNKQP